MPFLVLTEAEVERLLPMAECIGLMESALGALARGEVHQPLRMMVRPPQAKGLFALMPAHLPGPEEALGFKAVSVFHGNAELGLDSHQGAVVLLDPATGELQAVMHAGAITAIRTAAVSGLATKLLAREDARELAILGTGVQARTHLEAVACVRGLERVRVWGRTPEHARAFAEEAAGRLFSVEAVGSAEAAVRGADVVVTVTASPEPVLARAWLAPGAHVNAVGASLPTARELDTATVAEAALYVDRRESALGESGDYLIAAKEAGFGPEHIRGELGEVVIGAALGRASAAELTVFKSLGLAVEDMAAAAFLYRRAREAGVGTSVPL